MKMTHKAGGNSRKKALRGKGHPVRRKNKAVTPEQMLKALKKK